VSINTDNKTILSISISDNTIESDNE